jgi:hypothetical protein
MRKEEKTMIFFIDLEVIFDNMKTSMEENMKEGKKVSEKLRKRVEESIYDAKRCRVRLQQKTSDILRMIKETRIFVAIIQQIYSGYKSSDEKEARSKDSNKQKKV